MGARGARHDRVCMSSSSRSSPCSAHGLLPYPEPDSLLRARPSPASAPIHTWPAGERPRERLQHAGPQALAVRELLAILIGSGGRDGSALDVARRLLDRGGGSLRELGSLGFQELRAVPGVGSATAARIGAAIELSRRVAAEEAGERPRIRGPQDVHRLMAPHLRDLSHEEFHALILNTRHRVLRDVLVTRGILDASLIHPREVFRPAIADSAASVVLVHNHPSGDPEPSPEDRRVTRQLQEAGRTVGIQVLDHVVIGDGRWASALPEAVGRDREVPPP